MEHCRGFSAARTNSLTDDTSASSDPLQSSEMSFGDHLEELRSRIIRAVLSSIVAFLLVFLWHTDVMKLVVAPYTKVAIDLRMDASLKSIAPAGAFLAYLKVSFIVALVVSAPFWIYQFWAFIAAGLYKHERRAVYKFAPPMFLLFMGGVAFGYLVLIPVGLRYLLSFSDPSVIQNWIGLSEYLALFTTLTLVLGLVFELPIVMALLGKLGMISSRTFREKRRFFVLAAFIIGALLTPPDAVTQILMATPLIALFEIGIMLAWFAEGNRLRDVDWKAWRMRGILLVAACVLVFVFQERLVSAYHARLVGQKVVRVTDSAGGDTFPYMDVFARTRWLGFQPTAAYRVRDEESDDERIISNELWVVGNGERAVLARVLFRADRISDVSQEDDAARFLVMGGAQVTTVQSVEKLAGPQFLGPLITAFEQAAEEDQPLLEGLIAGLVGKRPEGARPLTSSADDATRRASLRAWAAWWKSHGAEFVWTNAREK